MAFTENWYHFPVPVDVRRCKYLSSEEQYKRMCITVIDACVMN